MELPDKLAKELQRELSNVMSLYMEGANDTEWLECSFCGGNAGMDEEVSHARDCLAVRLMNALDAGFSK